MPNFYFDTFGSTEEQRVVQDLIDECIEINGSLVYYIPMSNYESRDLIFGEDPLKKFTSAFPVDVYSKNVNSYDGEKEMFSKFGLDIKSYVTVLLSRRLYERRVPRQSDYNRPKEGDLIFVPWLSGQGEIFEITFVDADSDFFTLGRKQPNYYELRLEKFKYSQEVIATGIEDIDNIAGQDGYVINLHMGIGSGNYVKSEMIYQGNLISPIASATVYEWSGPDKVISVTNVYGQFALSANILGATSNSSYVLSSFDALADNTPRQSYDNKTIKTEANTIIITTETNPLGTLG